MTGARITIMLGGDVMTGRGIDQILSHPSEPTLYESFARSALDYVRLAEQGEGGAFHDAHTPRLQLEP